MSESAKLVAEPIQYHVGQFPPTRLDYARFIKPLLAAGKALAQYDLLLKQLAKPDPITHCLRLQDAALSSRLEGSLITLDELLRYHADNAVNIVENAKPRAELIDAMLYFEAFKAAQNAVLQGLPISQILIKAIHQQLFANRSHDAMPGKYKIEQDYLSDSAKGEIAFIPVAAADVKLHLNELIEYLDASKHAGLIKAAISHVEFLAIHPFKDGNSRVARMLSALVLQQTGEITNPSFYLTAYLAQHKVQYIHALRAVSEELAWDEWCAFFFTAVEHQALQHSQMLNQIDTFYQSMQPQLAEILSSKWSLQVLDFLMAHPVFRNNSFTLHAGIPPATAARFTKSLLDHGLLQTIEEGSGRRPALYAFEPLLRIIRV